MYGDIIREYKTKLDLTYDEMLKEMFKYYPGDPPTRQTIEHWAAERHFPDIVTLAIIAHNAPENTWVHEMTARLNQAVFTDKVQDRLASLKEE